MMKMDEEANAVQDMLDSFGVVSGQDMQQAATRLMFMTALFDQLAANFVYVTLRHDLDPPEVERMKKMLTGMLSEFMQFGMDMMVLHAKSTGKKLTNQQVKLLQQISMRVNKSTAEGFAQQLRKAHGDD